MQETQETWIQFLGWEDPLEKEIATHSSILAWEIPWTEKPGRLQSMGLQGVGHNSGTKQPQKQLNVIMVVTEHLLLRPLCFGLSKRSEKKTVCSLQMLGKWVLILKTMMRL